MKSNNENVSRQNLNLRSMAVLVGRAKYYRRTRVEKSRSDWGENNEKPQNRHATQASKISERATSQNL